MTLASQIAPSDVNPPPRQAGFWIRVLAAVLDFAVLGIALAVIVSFYCVFSGKAGAFSNLSPSETPHEILDALGGPFLNILAAIFLIGNWLYCALLESSRVQATLGKRIAGLYVTDLQYRPLRFRQATIRFLTGRFFASVPFLWLVYFPIDSLFVAFSPGKQSIHDRLASTFVLRKADRL